MGIRILIIDDEPGWIDFATSSLSDVYKVDVAKNLEAALSKLEERSYDLIIAGSGHPEYLGIISQQYPKTRMIVVTGQETIPEAIAMYRLGAFDYFTRDFRKSVVSEKIHEAIRKPVILALP